VAEQSPRYVTSCPVGCDAPLVATAIGVIALAGGLFGWLLSYATLWQRALLVVAAMCLITPGLITDSIGLGLLAVVAVVQLLDRRRAAESAVRA